MIKRKKGISEIQKSVDFRLIRNRKAISEIVAYVLLIVISISLALLVYAWLKSNILKPAEECPDSVSISIEYKCNLTKQSIDLKIKNNGLFTINGFIARASNKTGGLAICSLEKDDDRGTFFFKKYIGEELKPNEEYEISELSYKSCNNITRIEIEPFITNKEIILCNKAIVSEEVKNCVS